MANSEDFIVYTLEQMSLFAPVTARRMFGGHGLYLDDLMFALVVDDRLYLKADDATRGEFEQRLLPPFSYYRAGKTAVSLGYFEAPAEVFEDKADMLAWARAAHAAALRARKPAKAKKPAGAKTGPASKPPPAPAPAPGRGTTRKAPRKKA